MGQNTKIEWADHTFNSHIGCTPVSAACDHCYAERFGKRVGVEWGAGKERRRTSEANWRKPLAWDRAAAKIGKPARVFCSSLADVFDVEVPDVWRGDLFRLIDKTPHLIWMLLTKRPKVAAEWLSPTNPVPMGRELTDRILPRIWVGMTAEHQKALEAGIEHLLRIPAAVRFLSCEPLLGALDLGAVWVQMPSGGKSLWDVISPRVDREAAGLLDDPLAASLLGQAVATGHASAPLMPRIGWVIAGGESGPKARVTDPHWFRSLRDQCQAAGVAFFFKQWGEFRPTTYAEECADDLRLRRVYLDSEEELIRVGKARAGRLLDGREWNEVPHV